MGSGPDFDFGVPSFDVPSLDVPVFSDDPSLDPAIFEFLCSRSSRLIFFVPALSSILKLYHRNEYLNGRTPLETLLDELKEGWVTQYTQVDGSLFFASQKQVELMLPRHCTYGQPMCPAMCT